MNARHWAVGIAAATLLTGCMGNATNMAGLKDSTPLDAALAKMEPNRWVLLHRQSATDAVRFTRQRHGGSAFDSKRGRLILFGSDTHDKNPNRNPRTHEELDWKNNPFFFDMKTLAWSTPYPEDSWETYRVNEAGLPVAGIDAERPWAMHTFGALIYDPVRDEMVVCSWPGHMRPGRFTDVLAHVWDDVKKHPTWTYALKTGKWHALECDPVHFFPYAAAYDSDRNRIIGYGGVGIAELGGEPRTWTYIPEKSMFGWHNNAVYDSKNKALVVFGTNRNANDIVAYWPDSGKHVKMPTPGKRPPEDQHAPMCFDPESGLTVVVVDPRTPPEDGSKRTNQAETWLYDLSEDQWTQLPDASLPFPMGMNYNLEYDPVHKLCVLVADMPDASGQTETAVFALRVEARR